MPCQVRKDDDVANAKKDGLPDHDGNNTGGSKVENEIMSNV